MNKMHIKAVSKKTFDDYMRLFNITNDNVESYTNFCFISINGTGVDDEKPYFQNKKNVKIFYFDDVESDELTINHNGERQVKKAFTKEQAKELLDFIEDNKDKLDCWVHCAAGISRSGAVAAFINDYFGGSWYEFKRNNPKIQPNATVTTLLKKEVYNRI